MDSSFIKLENEIKADESIRDRDIMYELSLLNINGNQNS